MVEEGKGKKVQGKYPASKPLRTIDNILEKGAVIDFNYATHFLLVLRVDVNGRLAMKDYDIGVDVHPFKRYKR